MSRHCEKPTATKQSRKPGSPHRFAVRDDVKDRLRVNSMKILDLCKGLYQMGAGELPEGKLPNY